MKNYRQNVLLALWLTSYIFSGCDQKSNNLVRQKPKRSDPQLATSKEAPPSGVVVLPPEEKTEKPVDILAVGNATNFNNEVLLPNNGLPPGGPPPPPPGDPFGDDIFDGPLFPPLPPLQNISLCGNRFLNVGEQCDDGNRDTGDGCSPICLYERCGNGCIDPGEACDDGNKVDGDGCSNCCQYERCGNEIVDPGEQCDDGEKNGGDGCSEFCQLEICGDNVTTPNEECEDGNTTSGDGCSSTCTIEVPGGALSASGKSSAGEL